MRSRTSSPAAARRSARWCSSSSRPASPQICRNAGAEFVLYDMEHTGPRLRDAEDAVRAVPRARHRADGARAARRIPLHRPRARRRRARRHGADGRTRAEQAAHIVACTRYPPQGRRGAAFGFAHDDYQGGDVVDKMRAIHERTLVIPQIETARRARQRRGDRRGARRRRALARPLRPHQLPGHPGAVLASATTSTRSKRIVAACEAHGKAAGFMATDDDAGRASTSAMASACSPTASTR